MADHTPPPWRLRTTGNMGNLIEADSGKRVDHLDDGFRTVGSYQECCASDKYADQERNRDANGAFIVKAVNNHDALVDKLGKVVRWLERLAIAAERGAQNCSYESLREGYIADAKNYRKTMADIMPVLEAVQVTSNVGLTGS